MPRIYQTALEEVGRGRPATIETKLAAGEGQVADFARRLLTGPEAGTKKPQYTGNVFLEPFFPAERLIVLGGGHIAVPLVQIAALTGFAVTVVDDRPAFTGAHRFPDAAETVCDSFAHYLQSLEPTPFDYIVIITRGHRHDRDCLRAVAQKPFPRYVGMIGSRRRVQALLQQLREEGCDPEKLDRVNTPIGLRIAAVTPQEIAVSITAELIQRRRSVDTDAPATGHTDVDQDFLSKLVEVRQPCAVVTVVATKGSVPRREGAKMMVFPDGAISGSIGGGCSEAAVAATARDLIGTGRYLLQDIDMTGSVAEDEGMVCGGVMKVLIEDYGPSV